MPRLAANISTLFTELPFLDRIDAAAAAGFTAVECQFPYASDPDEIAGRLARAAVPLVLFNAPPGRQEAGERGLASLPGREGDFDASIKLAAQYALATGCRRVHVMAGLLPPEADRRRHVEQFVSGIARAADQLAVVGATALIEPINTRVDVPGYLLDGTMLALECIASAERPNLQLQYDVYHMQIMEGDLMRSIERLLPAIGHIQIADNPGRHEPGTGEINFGCLLARIDALGYSGFVGCEYVPESTTLAGLQWARSWLGVFVKVLGVGILALCMAASALGAEAVPDGRALLGKAANQAVDSLGRPDGFFGNPEIRIPLPGKLERVHKALQSLGVNDKGIGEKGDALVLAINRAAESALPESRALIAEAIQQMPMPDAAQLAAGGNDVLTRQLRATMSDSLASGVLPLVGTATKGVRLTEKYNEMASKASALGLLDPRDAELDGYVTRQALDRLFREMAKQESALRSSR